MSISVKQHFTAFIEDVTKERQRQLQKWGNKCHGWFVWLSILSEEVGELNRAALRMISHEGDIDSIKEELIQVASVCGALYEQLKELENREVFLGKRGII